MAHIMYIKKRERTQNWSPEEKQYLLEMCELRIGVLENKRVDSMTTTRKNEAWRDIHREFCSRFGDDRDVVRLREQWRRMKGNARTEMNDFAQKVKLFGPDIASQRKPNLLSERVWNLLNAVRMSEAGGGGETSDEGDTSSLSMDMNFTAVAEEGASSGHSSGSEGDEAAVDTMDIKQEIVDPEETILQDQEHGEPEIPEPDPPPPPPPASVAHAVPVPVPSPARPASKVMLVARSLGGGAASRQEATTTPTFKKRFVDLDSVEARMAMQSLEAKEREQNRRMEMLETEHAIKIETLKLEREAAQMMVARQSEQLQRQVRYSGQLGDLGSGAGKGGGGGGAIREAGGSFGKIEAGREEEFFYNQQKEQLHKLKAGLTDEISFHEEQIKRHQEAIARHKQRVKEIDSRH